jgi:hypothetical protein
MSAFPWGSRHLTSPLPILEPEHSRRFLARYPLSFQGLPCLFEIGRHYDAPAGSHAFTLQFFLPGREPIAPPLIAGGSEIGIGMQHPKAVSVVQGTLNQSAANGPNGTQLCPFFTRS